jgi:PAS domain S-box-containing protein
MILVVEDDAIEAMDIKRILESEGYIVPEIASSGEEAQQILKDIKPDLILMDIVLSGDIDGIKTAELIKKDYKIPVIYLTAHSEEGTVQRAKLTDPYAYLIKPFDVNELKRVIYMALYKQDMEEKLEGKRVHFQSLFENAPVGIFYSTLDGKFCMANKALSDILGYTSPDELIYEVNKTSINEKLYVDHDKRPEFVDEVLEDGKWHSYKNRYYKKDGSIILAELSFRLVKDKQGDVKYLEGFVNDITKQEEAEKALQDSESRYRLISENTGDVIWILNLETGKFNYVSPSVYNLRGYTPEEVLEQSQMDVMTFESFKYISENLPHRINAFLSGDESQRVSTTLVDQIHRDGSIIPTEVVTTLLVNEKGQIKEILGVSREISERKMIEESLIESESLLRGLFNNMTSGVAIYTVKNQGTSGKDYIIKEFNSAALEIEGKSKEEVIGKSIIDLRPNIEEYGLINFFKKVYDTGESYKYPAKMYVDENYSNWYENYIFKIPTGEIVAIYNDVTEQKASEEKLRESEEKYRSLFESDPDYTLLLDRIGNVVDINTAIINITGLSREELIGKHFIDLGIIIEDDLNMQLDKLPQLLNGQNIKPFEARLIDKYGKFRWINVQISTIEKNDKVMFILVIASDITDSKQFEKELKDSLREKEVLLQEIHHRVKNNMQIISSLMNIQTRYVDDAEAVNVLKESQNRVRSMAMIHEKLYRSKNFNKIYFAEYIESLVWDLFYSYSIRKGTVNPVLDIDDIKLNIETSVPCGLIITELVSNSLKYAFPDNLKGELKVCLKIIEDHYELTISDNGVGFPTNIDFKNTDSLGLQLVNSLTDQIDGEIELNSTHGTEFKIRFKELIYKDRN